MIRTVTWTFVIVAVLALNAPAGAQDQRPHVPQGWPCNGHPDAAYFRAAEATGGQVFLFHPSEIAGSATLMAAGLRHEQTIFRVAGSLEEGLHELAFPVDEAVESLLVSVSLQCLQLVEIARPSGALVQAADAQTEYAQFEAGQIVTIGTPSAGEWKVRVSGHGLFFLVVQAKSGLALGGVQVVRRAGDGTLTPVYTPLRPGTAEIVRIGLPDGVRNVRARLVSAAFEDLGVVGLREASDAGEGIGDIAVPPRNFRVVVSGSDENGHAFQRVHAPLFQVIEKR